MNFFREKLLNLNLFKENLSDAESIRRQILTTRLFLVLFISSLLILIIYTSFSLRVRTSTIFDVNLNVYRKLDEKYPFDLRCPCSQLSVPYGSFVTVEPHFHPVCSSQFVTQVWIDFLFPTNISLLWPMDVRTSFSSMWQIIASLCRNAISSLSNRFDEFTNSPLISPSVLSEPIVQAKAKATLNAFLETAKENFQRSILILQSFTRADGFLTGLSTNFLVTTNLNYSGFYNQINIKDIQYKRHGQNETCWCHRHESCPMPAAFYLFPKFRTDGFYDLNVLKANLTFKGLVVDCLPSLMTFQSTLECFHDELCLENLLTGYPRSSNSFSILNSSKLQRFSVETTLKTIIDELFIEKLVNQSDFSKYFGECRPNFCTFTYSQRFDWIFIVTTFVAVVGGLTKALRLISPLLIKIFFRLKKGKCRNNVQSNRIYRTMIDRLKNLNLFREDFSDDLIDLRRGRLATRFYLVAMLIALITLIFYTWQSVQLVTFTSDSPSVEQYEEFQRLYSSTLKCPCTTISIPFADILNIKATFHQICSSDLIEPWWYRSLLFSWSNIVDVNFASRSSSYFRALDMFCKIANLTFINANNRFASTLFVNALVLSRNSFESQTNTSIETFLRNTKAEFLYMISFLNDIVHGNQYANGQGTNVNFFIYPGSISMVQHWKFSVLIVDAVTFIGPNSTVCSCSRRSDCIHSIFRNVYAFMGVEFTCLMVDTVLKSSLLCWFNETCFTQIANEFIQSGVFIPRNVTLLDRSSPSRFSSNTTFEIIVNEMLIETFQTFVSYEEFYSKCRPSSCSFTYREQSSLIYIVTTIIALYGGLNIALRWIALFSMKILIRNRRIIETISTDERNSFRFLSDKYRKKLVKLNLFDSKSTQNDVVRHERISTRLYLILLFVCFFIFVIYTVLPTNSVHQAIENPSLVQYEDLLVEHATTLECPCIFVSIPYKNLLNVSVIFHQICSSDFISEEWMAFLFYIHSFGSNPISTFYNRQDFRVRGSTYFRLLSRLCLIAKKTIENAVDEFFFEQFLSGQMISENDFTSQISVVTRRLENTTTSRFINVLQLIRDFLHGETFLSFQYYNWLLLTDSNQRNASISTRPVVLPDGCSCGTRSDCVESATLSDFLNDTVYLEILGWKIGCSTIETVLRSTLECFYDRRCIDSIQNKIIELESTNSLGKIDIRPLNSSLKSRFDSTSQIQSLIDLLFVEQWKIDSSYENFYDQCKPMFCSFTTEERRNFLFVMAKILGLYGGLTVSLRFLVPKLVKLVSLVKRRFLTFRVDSSR